MHLRQLQCRSHGCQSAITVRGETHHFRARTQAAQAADNTQSRHRAAGVLSVAAIDPHFDAVRRPLVAGDGLYLHFVRACFQQHFFHGFTAGLRRIQHFKKIQNLFEQHV